MHAKLTAFDSDIPLAISLPPPQDSPFPKAALMLQILHPAVHSPLVPPLFLDIVDTEAQLRTEYLNGTWRNVL
jgi:hypothetical protein